MLLNTVVQPDPFMQHDTKTSNNPAKKSATTSIHMWLIRNQYEICIGAGIEMYNRKRSRLFLLED